MYVDHFINQIAQRTETLQQDPRGDRRLPADTHGEKASFFSQQMSSSHES